MSNYEKLKQRFKEQDFFILIGKKNKNAMKSEIYFVASLLFLITISLIITGIKFQNMITHWLLMIIITILLKWVLYSLNKYKRYEDLYVTIMDILYIVVSYNVLAESRLNNIPSMYSSMGDEFADKSDLLGYVLDLTEEVTGVKNTKSIKLQMFKIKFKNELHRVFDDSIDKMIALYNRDNIIAIVSYFIFTIVEIFLLKLYGKANISPVGKFAIIGASTIAWEIITIIMYISMQNIKIINTYKNNKKVYDFKYEKTQEEISELEEYSTYAINNLNKLDYETFDKAFNARMYKINSDLNNYSILLGLKGGRL